MGHKLVELNTVIINKLEKGDLYQKSAIVRAEISLGGEKVKTIVNGKFETTNVSKFGDWIVENPNGEKYIVTAEKFKMRYKPTNNFQQYQAIGFAKAISNPWNTSICIDAPWGEIQYGASNCFILLPCDSSGNKSGDPYIIENNAFHDTYEKVE